MAAGASLFMALIACGPLAARAADYVVICSGQSNMAGVAPIKDMPEDLRAMPPNVLYYESAAIDPKGTAIEPLKSFDATDADGSKNPRRRYGPVPRFAHAIAAARPNDRFIIVLTAVGGSALCQWVPDYAPKEVIEKLGLARGKYYQENKPKLDVVLKKYPDAKPLAFLWLQGESDTGAMADIYYDNLARLVANMRRDTGSPDLLALVAEPAEADKGVFEGITKFTQEDKHAALVVSREGGVRLSDTGPAKNAHLHFDAKGYDQIGKRFAAALLDRLEAATKTHK